jgi:RHS repeat-associated protein
MTIGRTGLSGTGSRRYRKHASAQNFRCASLVGSRRRRFCTSSPVEYERATTHASKGSFDRYYDPSTGQFLSVDPLVASTGQAYAAFGENPINNGDPLGLTFEGCQSPDDCPSEAGGNEGANFSGTGNGTGPTAGNNPGAGCCSAGAKGYPPAVVASSATALANSVDVANFLRMCADNMPFCSALAAVGKPTAPPMTAVAPTQVLVTQSAMFPNAPQPHEDAGLLPGPGSVTRAVQVVADYIGCAVSSFWIGPGPSQQGGTLLTSGSATAWSGGKILENAGGQVVSKVTGGAIVGMGGAMAAVGAVQISQEC